MSGSEEVLVGDTQRFECQVIGFPTPNISWFKDDLEITANPRYHIQFDEKHGIITLMIQNVAVEDEGCYQCKAENSEGFATTTAYLVVKVEDGLIEDQRLVSRKVEKRQEAKSEEQVLIEKDVLVTKAAEDTAVKEVIEEKTEAPIISYEKSLQHPLELKAGTNLYIEVRVSGAPSPVVSWFLQDQLLEDNARVSIESEEGFSYIKVKGASPLDSGVYKVTAENIAGKDAAQFEVYIKGVPSKPQNLRVEELYRDFVVLAWDAPESDGGDPITGYQIEKSLAGKATFVSAGSVDKDTTDFKVTKLFEGHDYLFRVYAENSQGRSDPAEINEPVVPKLPFDKPDSPENLHVTEFYKDYISVAWEAPKSDGGSKVRQYTIEKRDAKRAVWVHVGTVPADELTFKVTKLFQGNEYCFRVFAENEMGPGPPAEIKDPVMAKLPYDEPGKPQNLRATEVHKDFITIAWDAPESDGGAPITGYVIEKRDAKRRDYVFIADVTPDTFTYQATRLFEGNEYYFRVIAENQVGPGEPAEFDQPIKAKLPWDEPDAPRNLRVTDYWSDNITIAWDAPENDGGSPITRYIVEKREALRPTWFKAGTTTPEVTTLKAANLFEKTSYFFRVFAENDIGVSKTAAELEKAAVAKMPYDPPFAPQNLKVEDVNVDFITISWEAPEADGGSPITGYAIEKRNASRSTWSSAGTVDADTTSFTLDKLFEGEKYFIRVAAVNKIGTGEFLETKEFIVAKSPFEEPSAPRDFRVKVESNDRVTLTWDIPKSDGGMPITGYDVEFRELRDANYSLAAAIEANERSCEIGGLKEGREYYFRLFAINQAGLHGKPAETRDPIMMKAPFGNPGVPANFRVTGTDSGSISLAWDKPEDDGGSPITYYHIEISIAEEVNFIPAATVDGKVNEVELSGLEDGEQYDVRVYAENEAGLSREPAELLKPVRAVPPLSKQADDGDAAIDASTPSEPKNLKVTEVTRNSVTLSWETPDGSSEDSITGYIVEKRDMEDVAFNFASMIEGNVKQVTITGLTSGHQYQFRVFAENKQGQSADFSELDSPVLVESAPTSPAPPRNLQVAKITTEDISITWEAPEFDGGAPVKGYTILVRDSLTKKFKKAGQVKADVHEFTINKNIEAGHNYFIQVFAENEIDLSEEPLELHKAVHVPTEQELEEETAVKIEEVEIQKAVPSEEPEPVAEAAEPEVEEAPVEQKPVEEPKEPSPEPEVVEEVVKEPVQEPEQKVEEPEQEAVAEPEPEPVPVEVEPEPEPVAVEVKPEPEPVVEEAKAEPEPVVEEAQPEPEIVEELKPAEPEPEVEEVEEPKPAEPEPEPEPEAPTSAPTPPRNLHVVDVTSESCTLAWEVPESGAPITAYIIVGRPADKKKFKKMGKTDGKTLTFRANKNLEEGRKFMFAVYAENEIDVSESAAELPEPVLIVDAKKEDVVDAATEKPGAPKFLLTPEPVVFKKGDTIKLTAKAEGDPEPEVKWLKNGKVIKPKKYEDRIKIDWDIKKDIHSLTIKDATKSDAAEYTVVATGPEGESSFTAEVKLAEKSAKKKKVPTATLR